MVLSQHIVGGRVLYIQHRLTTSDIWKWGIFNKYLQTRKLEKYISLRLKINQELSNWGNQNISFLFCQQQNSIFKVSMVLSQHILSTYFLANIFINTFLWKCFERFFSRVLSQHIVGWSILCTAQAVYRYLPIICLLVLILTTYCCKALAGVASDLSFRGLCHLKS